MRSGRGTAAAALGCVFLANGLAQAQDAHLQGVFSGSVGFTDNVVSALEENPTQVEADGFGNASAGVIFSYATPRVSQTLTDTFAVNYFFSDPGATSVTNTAAWSGRFITTPTTSIILGATGTLGALNTLQLAQPSASGVPTQTPSGTTVFIQGGLTEGASKQFSPTLSAGQAGSFIVYDPLPDDPVENPPARTYSVTNTFSAQRAFRHDTAALALTSAYTHFTNVPYSIETADLTPSIGYETRDQLIDTFVASWQHDFGRHFSSQLDVGVTNAVDLKGDLSMLWQPAGLAALRYSREEAQVELAYARSVGLNVFLSQNMLVDQGTLRLAAPVSHAAHLDAEGSAGVQYGRAIDNGELTNPSTILLADIALLWSPITVIPDFGLSVRYQHTTQLAEEAVPTATDGSTRTTHLIRNAVVLSVSGAFPATTETSTRILITQPFGSSGPMPTQRRQAAPSEPTEEESSPASGPGPAE